MANSAIGQIDLLGREVLKTDNNIAYYVPEGFAGRNKSDKRVRLGEVDQHDVVTMDIVKRSPCHPLGKVPLSTLEDVVEVSDSQYDVYPTLDLMQKLAASRPGGYTGDGTNPADYYQHRVTCEECRDNGDARAQKRCSDDIFFDAFDNKKEMAKGGFLEFGVGAPAGVAAGTIISMNVWNPVGWGAAAVSGYFTGKSVDSARLVFKVGSAAKTAVDKYCDCTKYE